MKIKKIYESSNKDYYSVIYNNLLEINNLKKLIIDYIAYKENYNPPGFFVVDIVIKNDHLLVVTDSINNSYFNYIIEDKDKDDFNNFLNDPDAYKNSKKYNL